MSTNRACGAHWPWATNKRPRTVGAALADGSPGAVAGGSERQPRNGAQGARRAGLRCDDREMGDSTGRRRGVHSLDGGWAGSPRGTPRSWPLSRALCAGWLNRAVNDLSAAETFTNRGCILDWARVKPRVSIRQAGGSEILASAPESRMSQSPQPAPQAAVRRTRTSRESRFVPLPTYRGRTSRLPADAFDDRTQGPPSDGRVDTMASKSRRCAHRHPGTACPILRTRTRSRS